MLRTDFPPGPDPANDAAMQPRLNAIARIDGRGERLARHRDSEFSIYSVTKRYPTQV